MNSVCSMRSGERRGEVVDVRMSSLMWSRNLRKERIQGELGLLCIGAYPFGRREVHFQKVMKPPENPKRLVLSKLLNERKEIFLYVTDKSPSELESLTSTVLYSLGIREKGDM